MSTVHTERSRPRRNALLANGLIGVGVLLIALGAVAAFPALHSRLAVRPRPTVGTAFPTVAATATPGILTFYSPLQELLPTAEATDPQPAPTPAVPTRIVIPTIGVDAPVVVSSWHTTVVDGQVLVTWDVPQMYAAGWHETSAPLGVPGNTVLNGHNTGHGEVFRDLYRLQPGAPVVVYAGDRPFSYVVSETLILREAGQPLSVRQQNARYIMSTEDERLTLVTCHPYGSTRDRLIVIAVPEAKVPAEHSAERGTEHE